jgi:hypothetical protein
MPPFDPKLTWINDDTTGGFGFYNVIPNSRGYEIRCMAPNSRIIWRRGLRITSGAIDTVVCLMQPRDPHKPQGRNDTLGP